MGRLIDGVWHAQDRRTDEDGRFIRAETRFRARVTADGGAGFPAVAGRYHLYVSLACPWAHRTLIARRLKGLEGAVGLSVVDPEMGPQGWAFSERPGCIPDPVLGARYLRELYIRAAPRFSGRVTVPVLWDRERATIVNNESAEIVRMFDAAFPGIADAAVALYPVEARAEIDAVNARIFRDINDGVYRVGFAAAQGAYEEAFDRLFAALDWAEGRLSRTRYLCGPAPTEADWRLFTTLVRFDAVYFGHFKCNLRRIADYPCLPTTCGIFTRSRASPGPAISTTSNGTTTGAIGISTRPASCRRGRRRTWRHPTTGSGSGRRRAISRCLRPARSRRSGRS